jgi:hypothetical protein
MEMFQQCVGGLQSKKLATWANDVSTFEVSIFVRCNFTGLVVLEDLDLDTSITFSCFWGPENKEHLFHAVFHTRRLQISPCGRNPNSWTAPRECSMLNTSNRNLRSACAGLPPTKERTNTNTLVPRHIQGWE